MVSVLVSLLSLSLSFSRAQPPERTIDQVSRALATCLKEQKWTPRNECFKKEVANIKSDDTYWSAIQAIQNKCITKANTDTIAKRIISGPSKPDVLASSPELEDLCFEAGLGMLRRGIPTRMNPGDVDNALNLVKDSCANMNLIVGPATAKCVQNGFNAVIQLGADYDKTLNASVSLVSKMCLEPTTAQQHLTVSRTDMVTVAMIDGVPAASLLCIENMMKSSRHSRLRDLVPLCNQGFNGSTIARKDRSTCYFRELLGLSLQVNSECSQKCPQQTGDGSGSP